MPLAQQTATTDGSHLSSTLVNNLDAWFAQRPQWLRDAARRLLQQGRVSEHDLDELLVLCKMEAIVPVDAGVQLAARPVAKTDFTAAASTTTLRLDSIRDVRGINALAPRKALEFGAVPMTIVYGPNGSGKSGYMRILKHVCGARAKGVLLPNAFGANKEAQSCTIGFTRDGVEATVTWTPDDGIHPDLRTVEVYDTDCANVQVDEENELSFEPGVLAVFRRLAEISDTLAARLDAEIAASAPLLPHLPGTHAATATGGWYTAVSHTTTDEEIAARCAWTAQDDVKLAEMTLRLAEKHPRDAAAALRRQIGHLTEFVRSMTMLDSQLGGDSFAMLQALRGRAESTRRAATQDAEAVFANAPLEGVATESWKALWQQARVYSETEAYVAYEFPHVADDALCVLCQQPLDVAAAGRLVQFEAFVKGGLEREAGDAEGALRAFVEALPTTLSEEEVMAQLDLGDVQDPGTRAAVAARYAQLRARWAAFQDAADAARLPQGPATPADTELAPVITAYDSRAKLYDADAAEGSKEALARNVAELNARKWVAAQKQTVLNEVMRHRMVQRLLVARRLTDTRQVSIKKSELAEDMVTAAFKTRFERELKSLRGGHIRVGVNKTRTVKGKAKHKVHLVGSTMIGDAGQILSEGEFRVVSIAAFLADVTGSGTNTPILFDDPVTSLDQDFEEATCARIATLAKTRQVVVFTHRLSFLSLLQSAAGGAGVEYEVKALQREPWGTGEPTSPPQPAQKPAKALNSLLDQRLSQAKKTLDSDGYTAYNILAKAICSDVRITVERIVEYDLLADVVERFRRPINTMGKLEKVAKITLADCQLIDEMMTKYSYYEHSQPGEAPVALPEPDELEADLTKLKNWLAEFTKRPVPVA